MKRAKTAFKIEFTFKNNSFTTVVISNETMRAFRKLVLVRTKGRASNVMLSNEKQEGELQLIDILGDTHLISLSYIQLISIRKIDIEGNQPITCEHNHEEIEEDVIIGEPSIEEEKAEVIYDIDDIVLEEEEEDFRL